MLKEYLQDRNLSIYQLSKESGVPYSTVSDLVNGKTSAGNCKASIIAKLASALQISMEEFLSICEQMTLIQTDHGSVEARTYARNRIYYVAFRYNEKIQELRVCPVCKDGTLFLKDFTEWAIDNFLVKQQLEVITDELCHHAKK